MPDLGYDPKSDERIARERTQRDRSMTTEPQSAEEWAAACDHNSYNPAIGQNNLCPNCARAFAAQECAALQRRVGARLTQELFQVEDDKSRLLDDVHKAEAEVERLTHQKNNLHSHIEGFERDMKILRATLDQAETEKERLTKVVRLCEEADGKADAVIRAAMNVIGECDLRFLGRDEPEGDKAQRMLDILHDALAAYRGRA